MIKKGPTSCMRPWTVSTPSSFSNWKPSTKRFTTAQSNFVNVLNNITRVNAINDFRYYIIVPYRYCFRNLADASSNSNGIGNS
jgi:hypothetical protein